MTTVAQPLLFEPWHEFQHPTVRQLAFAIASPNILCELPKDLAITHSFDLHHASFWQVQYQQYEPRLRQLEQNPRELIEFLQRLKSTRLGLRFEMLIWFWLLDRDYHVYELLGHSIQKIAGPKTLGELDFLVLNTDTQHIEHWEVALKFYLAEANLELRHWYGLNRTDTLQRKLVHFSHQQFQFDSALDYPIQQRFAVLKGQLYLPRSIHTLPSWINLERRIGQWGYHPPQTAVEYYRLQRQEWICSDPYSAHSPVLWWTDGLYKSIHEQYYMFRNRPVLQISPTGQHGST